VNASAHGAHTVKGMASFPFPVEVSVVGVSWHQDNVVQVEVGDPVHIYLEPENPYDANARRVDGTPGILGHLPKEVAARLAKEGVGEMSGVIVSRGGRDVAGLKIRISPTGADTVTRTEPVQDTAPTEPNPFDIGDARMVRVKDSGRVLGAVRGVESGRVQVRTTGGTLFSVPEELVAVDFE
jgi:hypothetical protein